MAHQTNPNPRDPRLKRESTFHTMEKPLQSWNDFQGKGKTGKEKKKKKMKGFFKPPKNKIEKR